MSARNIDFETSGAADEVDLGGIGTTLRRNLGLIVAATLGVALAAALFCAVVKPRYMAESRILVETQENYYARADADPRQAALFGAEVMNSQMQLITSRDLARKAVISLHLQGNPEFDPAAGLNPLSAIAAALGLIADPNAQSAEDRLMANYFDHLTVLSPTGTNMLQVAFSSRDADLAALGANQIADLFIELKSLAKRKNAHQAARRLKPLIASLEARVAEADAKVEAYRSAHGPFESGENTNAPTQQQGETATRLAEARLLQSDALAKARALREWLASGRLGDVSDDAASDSVRRIADQRGAARAQLALEARTRPPGHPRIKELEAQLSDLESQLRAAVEKDARMRENEASVAGSKVANLTLLEGQKHPVGAANSGETQLRELQRDAKTLRFQLEAEVVKYQAALARDAANIAPADARIVSRALSPSQPVFPKKIPIVIFAAFAGLFFSVATIFAREIGRGGPSGASRPAPPAPRQAIAPDNGPNHALDCAQGYDNDEEKPFFGRLKQAVAEYGAPAVALVGEKDVAQELQRRRDNPWKPLNDETPTTAPRRAFAAAPSRSLIDRIAASIPPSGGVRVVLASAVSSAPACFALAVARAMSREGRAILIQAAEADPHLSGALSRAAGDENLKAAQPGLAQLLTGEASFAESIFRDSQSRLHIVPAGGAAEAAEEDLELLIDALQATYDYVLIAASADGIGAALGRQADISLIFAENARNLDFLHDEFATAGARHILLASLDGGGEIVEAA